MGKKRQISHVEVFQIIYVDTSPARWGSATGQPPLSPGVGWHSDFQSKVYNVEKWRESQEKGSNSTVEMFH